MIPFTGVKQVYESGCEEGLRGEPLEVNENDAESEGVGEDDQEYDEEYEFVEEDSEDEPYTRARLN